MNPAPNPDSVRASRDLIDHLQMLATLRDDLLGKYGARGVMAAAADEIERLRADLARSERALAVERSDHAGSGPVA
jgi:hypothetical protein